MPASPGRLVLAAATILTAELAAAVGLRSSVGTLRSALRDGAPPLDPLVGLVACGLAGVVALWLGGTLALAVGAQAAPPTGALHRLAGRLCPVVVRRSAALLLGTGLVGSALAAPASAEEGWSADRPVAGAASAAAVPAGPPVVVRPGDTLWAIAADRLGPAAGARQVGTEWRRWYAQNRAVVGPDPDLIRPGQRLRPPRP